MGKSKFGTTTTLLKQIFSIVIISLIGVAGIVFTVLYVDTFESGFMFDYATAFTSVTVSIISVCTVFSIIFLNKNNSFINKLFTLFIVIIFLVLLSLYLIKVTGLYEKIKSIEDFRKYISSFGNFAVLLFILIQFLQVVVLPIPGVITVGAGVLLFGPFFGAVYSCIGIIAGSICAFFIGRIFGFRIAKWLVGEHNLNKCLKIIKGKDKVVVTFMYLFPFFPDDVLCFVAGITTMSTPFFLVMIFITRTISVFVSAYSMNNSIIPYDTWWGILLWIAFFCITVIIAVLVYKNGDKLNSFLFKKRKKKTYKK